MKLYIILCGRTIPGTNPKLVPRHSLLHARAKFEVRVKEGPMSIGDVTAHLRLQTFCTENTLD